MDETQKVIPTLKGRVFNYEGYDVAFSTGDSVMVNATEMAQKFGDKKKPNFWLKTKASKEFVTSLSEVRKINSSDLVKVIYGDNGGTWMHEDVALEFARWLSPDFAIWCNDRIKELMRYGMTATPQTLEDIVSNPDLLIQLATQLKQERAEKAALAAENQRQQNIIEMKDERIEMQKSELEAQAPKVRYYDETLQSTTTMTTTQIAKMLGTDAEKLNKRLQQAGLIYKQSGMWHLYHPYDTWMMHGVRTTTYTRSDGTIGSRSQTVWTERGRYFIARLNENGYDLRKTQSVLLAEKESRQASEAKSAAGNPTL